MMRIRIKARRRAAIRELKGVANVAKLSWEYADNGTDIYVKKARGKITIQELFDFLHEPKQTNYFDGCLAVVLFRVNSERDIPMHYEEPEGDTQLVYMLGDDADCPVCGTKGMAVQYCPDCGRKLY